MSAAAWVCDSCETNNLAQAGICRVCQRAPGSVTGAVTAVDTAQAPDRPMTERPVFVESKHTGQYRPPAEPARIDLTPPPARGPRPARRPAPPPPPHLPARPSGSSSGTWSALAWIFLTAAVVGLMLVLVANAGELFSSGPQGEPPTGTPAAAHATRSTPCPSAVATWMPDGGTGATLVAGYTTDKHVVTICRDASGQLYYDGQVRGAAPSNQTHISLRASTTPNGFMANNQGYVYEINGSQLIVTNNGKDVLRTTLTRTGP